MAQRGILLANLGSPDSPDEKDVRRYLNEFLMDGHVLDVPYLLRRFIVSCFILPKRPRESGEAYKSIWWSEGSPLVVISRRVQQLLQERLSDPVELAMRYGNPSTRHAIEQLLERCGEELEEILLVPLYPHYAMSTIGSTVDCARDVLRKLDAGVRLEVLRPYYRDERYIAALAESMRGPLEDGFDHLLFSYHGLPERHLRKTDPTRSHCLKVNDCCRQPSAAHEFCYRHQVLETTARVVEALGIPDELYSVAFQSRLGRDPWLKPMTSSEIERLAKSGVRRLAVVCPAFVSDCLETLEEIGIRGKEEFLAAGGEEFTLIPCVNDDPRWIDALEHWCLNGADAQASAG